MIDRDTLTTIFVNMAAWVLVIAALSVWEGRLIRPSDMQSWRYLGFSLLVFVAFIILRIVKP